MLKRLQEKADRSFKAIEDGSSPGSNDGSPSSPMNEDEDDQLAIFGGQLRVVTKKLKPKDEGCASPTSPKGRHKSRSGSTSQLESSSPNSSPIIPTYHRERHNSASLFLPRSDDNRSERSSLFTTNQNTYADSPSLPRPHPSALDFSQSYIPNHIASNSSSLQPEPSYFDWSLTSVFGNATAGPSNTGWSADLPPQSFSLSDVPPLLNFNVQGSDASLGQYPQASQYDLQENAGLLASMIQHDPMHPNQGGLQWNPAGGFFPDGSGVDLLRTPMANPGAVELGLSGESRHDSGWIAFMRDCGILGMDTSS